MLRRGAASSFDHMPTSERWGQSKGFSILFWTEIFERLSYYGSRSILFLYMIKYLLVDLSSGEKILGFRWIKGIFDSIHGPLSLGDFGTQVSVFYIAAISIAPLFGGMITDWRLGQMRSVIIGSILMIIGSLLLSFDNLFFISLIFFIVGSGIFRPNIATQLGDLYSPNDPRRDGAFTYFYFGSNMAASLAVLIVILGESLGWHWGFAGVAASMIAGLCVYVRGRKYLVPHPDNLDSCRHALELGNLPFSSAQKKIVWTLILLSLLNMLIWAIHDQQERAVQLWAESLKSLTLFGLQVPYTWNQSLIPLFFIIFAPFLPWFWKRQSKKGTEPITYNKLVLACFFISAAAGLMTLAVSTAGDSAVSFLWLLPSGLLLPLSELYLVPIGLSLVTKSAPSKKASTMVGLWLLSLYLGGSLSRYLITLYKGMGNIGFFALICSAALGAGSAMVLFKKYKFGRR